MPARKKLPDGPATGSFYRQATDFLSVAIGFPPGDWARMGKTISPLSEDGELFLEGVKQFVEWYRESSWRTENRPLTSLVFLSDFPSWYAAWKAGNIVIFSKDDASFILATDLDNLELPITDEWRDSRFSWEVFKTLNLSHESNRFLIFKHRVGERLPSFADRAEAMRYIKGFVAILVTNYAWIVQESLIDNVLKHFDSIDKEFRKLSSRHFVQL